MDILIYNMDVLEGYYMSAPGTMVYQVHFSFGVHLVSFFPIGYRCMETVNPF